MSGPIIECADCHKTFQLAANQVTTWCQAIVSDGAGKPITTVGISHVYNHCQPWHKELDEAWKSSHQVATNILPSGFISGTKIKWVHVEHNGT